MYISFWAPSPCKPVFKGEFCPWVCNIKVLNYKNHILSASLTVLSYWCCTRVLYAVSCYKFLEIARVTISYLYLYPVRVCVFLVYIWFFINLWTTWTLYTICKIGTLLAIQVIMSLLAQKSTPIIPERDTLELNSKNPLPKFVTIHF